MNQLPRSVLIIGTGLVGGSIGLGLKAAGVSHVTGVDVSRTTAVEAARMGAIDEVAEDPGEAAGGADVVVIATPVGQIVGSLRLIAGRVRPATVVTDVGSTKGQIVADAEAALGSGAEFVGGHPMAGSERDGIDAARADLFDGALWLLTPTANTDAQAFRRVHALVSSLGAKVLALDPAAHDHLVAIVSHLPYALSTVLMDVAASRHDERVFQAAAGSFRDLTRTAGSNPRIWQDILAANREAVLSELDTFATHLAAFRDAVAAGHWDLIHALIERAAAARRRLPLKGTRPPVEPVVLEIPVPDRAGVLAEITTAVGDLGVNIEDLRLEHFGGTGVVHLVLDGRDAAERASAQLRGRGLRVGVLEDRS